MLIKGHPIEAIYIIAREVKRAADQFEVDFIRRCQGFLRSPGISVVKDAQVALSAGKVSAMHDPTEGGIAAGLWELAAGALFWTTPEPEKTRLALEQAGIPAYVIGKVTDGKGVNLPRPARDEIAK